MDTTREAHLIERAAARLRPSNTGPEFLAPLPGKFGRVGSRSQDPIESPRRVSAAAEPANARKPLELAALTRAGLLDNEAYSRTAEEFRVVQNRLLREERQENGIASRGPQNLVMVTSALTGEGKSFASINLAGEVARHHDRRVLLIDADPKSHGLGHELGLSDKIGLLDLARDSRLDLADAIIPTAANFLEVLPLGTNEKATGELFASRRINEIGEEISRRYGDGLVIFDTPPCLSSSIPHILANLVGQAVFVVAAGSTQQQDVESAVDLIRSCPSISLLLNKIPPWLGSSFGNYHYVTT